MSQSNQESTIMEVEVCHHVTEYIEQGGDVNKFLKRVGYLLEDERYWVNTIVALTPTATPNHYQVEIQPPLSTPEDVEYVKIVLADHLEVKINPDLHQQT